MQNEYMGKLKECRICPRNCGVNRLAGEIGFCGAGQKARLARAALHQWEEPCISGVRGSGTVFFSFCNLRCVFCQNYEISQNGNGLEVGLERLSEIFLELQEKGAHNINLVTPTHYIPQIAAALAMAKENGLKLPIVYNSSGYESVEGLKMLDGLIDVYMPDVKFNDGKISKELANCEDYFSVAMNALEEMYRQTGDPLFDSEGMMLKGVLVRHLLLPGQLESAKKIIEAIFEQYGNRIFYSLMNQYTPIEGLVGNLSEKLMDTKISQNIEISNETAINLQKKTTVEEYEEWVDFAIELGLENGFIQEEETAEESFIPAFDFEGVNPLEK